jgi:hypothetical protein
MPDCAWWFCRSSLRSVTKVAELANGPTLFTCCGKGSGIRQRNIVVCLSPGRPGFALRSVHVRFVVDKVALGQVFIRVLRFSLVNISFHRGSPYSYIIWGNNRPVGGLIWESWFYAIDVDINKSDTFQNCAGWYAFPTVKKVRLASEYTVFRTSRTVLASRSVKVEQRICLNRRRREFCRSKCGVESRLNFFRVRSVESQLNIFRGQIRWPHCDHEGHVAVLVSNSSSYSCDVIVWL